MSAEKLPKGWRKLRSNEIIRRGDKYFYCEALKWKTSELHGERVSDCTGDIVSCYIRRTRQPRKHLNTKSK